MFKMLFADDEAHFRAYFRHVIDWTTYQIELCGEAKNGMEMISLIEEHQPSIVFLDINMPYMNGIEVAQKIKQIYPSIFIVLVTGHNEFHYIHQAMKIGVDDYILKPFDEDELIETIHKVVDKLDQTRLTNIKEESDLKFKRDSFISYLINVDQTYDEKMMEEKFAELFSLQIASHYQAICIEIVSEQEIGLEELKLRKYIIYNILSDLFPDENNRYIVYGPENQVLIMLYGDLCKDNSTSSESAIQELFQVVKTRFRFKINIGIGNGYDKLEYFQKSYEEAVLAIQYSLIYPEQHVFYHADVELFALDHGFYSGELNDDLLISLRKQDREKIISDLKLIHDYIIDQKYSIENVHMMMLSLISVVMIYINESDLKLDSLLSAEQSPMQEIKKMRSITVAMDWIENIYLGALELTKKQKYSKSAQLLNKAIAFVDQNYANSELKIEDIAKQFYVQPRYLLKIFKEGIGISANDYLIQTRMNKAKQLLLEDHSYKLSYIAEQVGYNDLAYFSKSFKKYTGFSPSEYSSRSGMN